MQYLVMVASPLMEGDAPLTQLSTKGVRAFPNRGMYRGEVQFRELARNIYR